MPRIIYGFTGKMGCGKSTAAKALQGYGFTRVRFAGPLKAMIACLGLNEREIEGDLKETPCALLGGVTPRRAMQTLGTDWARDMIHPDLWINAWINAVNKLPAHIPVVCDDVRFPNEAEAIKSLGGVLIRIERPSSSGLVQPGHIAGHASELMTFDADRLILNNGTVGGLHDEMRKLVWPDEGDEILAAQSA